MQSNIKENLLQIQEEIAPYKPNIIAVTKYFDESAIIEAYAVGLRNFAESRAVEAVEKINNLPLQIKENSTFHFIGHLQTNKVKKVIANFDYIHSVDSLRLAKIISQEAQNFGKVQKILLEVNIAEEVQKYGLAKNEIYDVFQEVLSLSGIELSGLMCMAPLGEEQGKLESLFEQMKNIKQELEKRYGCNLELSMGMSQDYNVAVKYGATMLRIGRKLFK